MYKKQIIQDNKIFEIIDTYFFYYDVFALVNEAKYLNCFYQKILLH